MTNDLSTTKTKDVIWEEKNWIAPPMNSGKSSTSAECDTTGNMPNKSGVMDLPVITDGKICGIYKIVNIVNGKYYVGSSVDIRKRWREHISSLSRGIHRNIHLQRAWNKYRSSNFEFIIICHNVKNLLTDEQLYLDIAKTEKYKTYNICWDASSTMLGRKHSEMTKQKISLAGKGRKLSDETRHNISKSKMGNKHPHFGIPLSDLHKRKIGIGVKGDKNAAYNPTQYTFHNTNTNDILTGTYYDFYTKYNYNRSGVGKLIHGKTKMYKGWILI